MAATKEEAVKMVLADAEVQAHVAQTHPELAGKSPEETEQMMAMMVQEEMETPMGGTGIPGDAPMA